MGVLQGGCCSVLADVIEMAGPGPGLARARPMIRETSACAIRAVQCQRFDDSRPAQKVALPMARKSASL